MDKIEQVIKRMRWKTFFYINPSRENMQQIYGLKTLNCPPKIKEMVLFERDLWDLVNKIKFRKVSSNFQNQLKEDIKAIKKSKKIFVFADKTSNIYQIEKDEYSKLTTDASTSAYKKVSDKISNKVNADGKKIIENKAVVNRMFVNGSNSCFITLKDHKPNFLNNPKVRLINPAKNELGRISKSILDRINTSLRNLIKVNQWKDIREVIEWFKNITNKQEHKFIVFDIKEFYPTITKDLLTKCLKFAEEKVQISNDDKKIIYHARTSLLFNEEGTWMKKDGLFDVTMGAYDRAEVCELVGTFLLDKISEKYEKNSIGLYCDDGLSVFKNKSGTQLERIKKNLQKTFEDFGLEIVAESNLKIVNYLDVTLNLNNGSFKPYYKPDDIIQYINKESNHPPSIIEHLPASIEKRLSNNSSDETIFKEAAIYYEDTLNKAGYINNLVYHTPSTSNQENKNKSRQWNVIWFNPPYSKNVATRIGQSFLHLIDTHFPKTHIFNKIFNRNKVKVSYSSMQNIKGIINNHNRNILHQNNEIKDECNCRNKKYYPLGGKCLSPNIVYQGKINSSQPSYNEKVYII